MCLTKGRWKLHIHFTTLLNFEKQIIFRQTRLQKLTYCQQGRQLCPRHNASEFFGSQRYVFINSLSFCSYWMLKKRLRYNIALIHNSAVKNNQFFLV